MEHLLYIYDFDYMTVSFGFSDTLLTASVSSISSELDELSLVAAGGSLGLVRLSVGYTRSAVMPLLRVSDPLSVQAALRLDSKDSAEAPPQRRLPRYF